MKKILLFLSFLLMSISMLGVDMQCTLSNTNIVAGGTASDSYGNKTMIDECSQTWNAYAIKKYHSNATSSYHYLQIKKYASNTAYYI